MSKVTYQNQSYSRDDLMLKRQNILNSADRISVETLSSAIEEEELRLDMINGGDKLRTEQVTQYRESYGDKETLNNRVAEPMESQSTFIDNTHVFGNKKMSFRDINNDTVKYDEIRTPTGLIIKQGQ